MEFNKTHVKLERNEVDYYPLLSEPSQSQSTDVKPKLTQKSKCSLCGKMVKQLRQHLRGPRHRTDSERVKKILKSLDRRRKEWKDKTKSGAYSPVTEKVCDEQHADLKAGASVGRCTDILPYTDVGLVKKNNVAGGSKVSNPDIRPSVRTHYSFYGKPVKSRRQFSKRQEDDVKSYFAAEIADSKLISISYARYCLKNEFLPCCRDKSPKQVQDKVHHLVRKKNAQNRLPNIFV
ncbi:uncharacterized protein LOC143452308 [Clavelina lepadiformis]|uniref:uncharacterized protein LOC143452308 n=1 Tax=Clavelina lepadiformis TaxID=159417 RepID=UPI00404223BC